MCVYKICCYYRHNQDMINLNTVNINGVVQIILSRYNNKIETWENSIRDDPINKSKYET